MADIVEKEKAVSHEEKTTHKSEAHHKETKTEHKEEAQKKEETTHKEQKSETVQHKKDENTHKESKTETVNAHKEQKSYVPHSQDRERSRFGGNRFFDKESPREEQKEAPIFVKKKSPFSDYKIFNKWNISEVVVSDLSLVRYINLDPVITPHSSGRKSKGRFGKANMNIVERLINKTMRSGQGKRKLSGKYIRGRGSCGKKIQAMNIVEKAFEIVELKTKKNPVQALVDAIQNAAPREDVTRVKKGGVAYTLAVDVAPMKRLDEAIKNIALAGFGNSFNKKTSAQQALAEEIIAASTNDNKSTSIKRKDEVERIAKASR